MGKRRKPSDKCEVPQHCTKARACPARWPPRGATRQHARGRMIGLCGPAPPLDGWDLVQPRPQGYKTYPARPRGSLQSLTQSVGGCVALCCVVSEVGVGAARVREDLSGEGHGGE